MLPQKADTAGTDSRLTPPLMSVPLKSTPLAAPEMLVPFSLMVAEIAPAFTLAPPRLILDTGCLSQSSLVTGNRSSSSFCGVEVWRGGLGGAYRLPTLSSVGASLFPPCFRFHTPLIEPDVRICRIRLSEKTHTQSPWPLHVTPSATSGNNLGVVRLIANLPFRRRFVCPPSTEAPSQY